MLWFLGGYVLVAVAFYSYITTTAQEEPEALQMGLGMPSTVADYVRTDGKVATDSEDRSRKIA
jgi:hypothetical protein